MRVLRYALFLGLLALPLALARPAQAQVAVGIGIGPDVGYPGYYGVGGPPVCEWGYYSYYPYACAPYGYWGPDWFYGGVFIGAGPWFHGPANFRGHVNNRLHPDHGYKGPTPPRGAKPDAAHPVGKVAHFKGNETRDGRGHVAKR